MTRTWIWVVWCVFQLTKIFKPKFADFPCTVHSSYNTAPPPHTHTHTHIATEWSTDIPETQLLPTRGAFPSWPPLSPLCPLQEQDLIRRRRAGGRGQLSQEHSRLRPWAQQVGSIMCILTVQQQEQLYMSLMKHKYGGIYIYGGGGTCLYARELK